MKHNFWTVLMLSLFVSSTALADGSQSFDDLVKSCIAALQEGNQQKFMAHFIDDDALIKSITEDSYPNNPKEKKATLKRMEQGGKARILSAVKEARSNTWNDLNPQGFDWKKAVVTSVQPSFNTGDGIEKTDWARVNLRYGKDMYLIKLNQARKTAAGWKLVFGGKLKGPRPAAETE